MFTIKMKKCPVILNRKKVNCKKYTSISNSFIFKPHQNACKVRHFKLVHCTSGKLEHFTSSNAIISRIVSKITSHDKVEI